MAPPESEGGVFISTKDIYDHVVAIRAELQTYNVTAKTVEKILEDHETRIRANERWKYALPVTSIAGFFSGIAALLGHLFSK